MVVSVIDKLRVEVARAIEMLYGAHSLEEQIQLQKCKREFEGHVTLVVFPLLKISRKSPEETAKEIGAYLKEHTSMVVSIEVIKGFLNLTIGGEEWLRFFDELSHTPDYGYASVGEDAPLIMVEYSSPNTNKPLHLGHIRNNLLGYSLSKILEANGWRVVKTNIVNDRGIHICKSMLAWQKWGEGATPESTGNKGDHLVGDFYVLFDKHYKAELKALMEQGKSEEEAEASSALMQEARALLRRWEEGDHEVIALWRRMNEWVYAGFDETYKRLGVDFDKIYYESETYLEGKQEVLRGLQTGILQREADGSIWIDLTNEGLDRKILLRSDGTSVYMTQDIGTAKLRFDDYPIDKMVYVVGNEQNYHFQVLSKVLDRLGFEFGRELIHFSYGMVELPNGKMKSREGTVVDADDLMDQMIETAYDIAKQAGRAKYMSEHEALEVARRVGLGCLKYFILKVDPRKNMVFDPEESIDFNGNTAAFIQYTYARICSLLRKAEGEGIAIENAYTNRGLSLSSKEEELIGLLGDYADVVREAGANYSPSTIANYVYELVKEYNQFYHDFPILKEEDALRRSFRLSLSATVGQAVSRGMALLGIEMPEGM